MIFREVSAALFYPTLERRASRFTSTTKRCSDLRPNQREPGKAIKRLLTRLFPSTALTTTAQTQRRKSGILFGKSLLSIPSHDHPSPPPKRDEPWLDLTDNYTLRRPKQIEYL